MCLSIRPGLRRSTMNKVKTRTTRTTRTICNQWQIPHNTQPDKIARTCVSIRPGLWRSAMNNVEEPQIQPEQYVIKYSSIRLDTLCIYIINDTVPPYSRLCFSCLYEVTITVLWSIKSLHDLGLPLSHVINSQLHKITIALFEYNM